MAHTILLNCIIWKIEFNFSHHKFDNVNDCSESQRLFHAGHPGKLSNYSTVKLHALETNLHCKL